MRCQSGIIVGLFDEILGSRPLVIEPDQRIDRPRHVGDEHPIEVFRAVEQLVLLALFRFSPSS